jgi:hypothetical protein
MEYSLIHLWQPANGFALNRTAEFIQEKGPNHPFLGLAVILLTVLRNRNRELSIIHSGNETACLVWTRKLAIK